MAAGPDLRFKVVISGSFAGGKSAIIRRAVDGTFRADGVSTIGASFFSMDTELEDGTSASLDVWDTSGQERYASVAAIHFRGAQIGIVVFSLIDETSFEAVPSWVERVREGEEDAIICIVGNKLDLAVGEARRVRQEDAEALATALGATYTETSALTGEGVDELFSVLANKVPRSAAIPRRAKVDLAEGGASGGGCSC